MATRRVLSLRKISSFYRETFDDGMEIVPFLDFFFSESRDQFSIEIGHFCGTAGTENEIDIRTFDLRELQRFVEAIENFVSRIRNAGFEFRAGYRIPKIDRRI